MITAEDVAAVAERARRVPPARESYLEDDFVTNLLATVVDFQTHTTAVERALQHFKDNRWDEVRTASDLEEVFKRWPDEKDGNTALAQYLWGYKMWTRAQLLRRLVEFFRQEGVHDQPSLRTWAEGSEFKRDFEGRVKGLGIAVYHWLVMRQGVDTVKPDVHIRRFAESTLGRKLSDEDVVDVMTRAAHHIGMQAYQLDWAIWEASRDGAI